MTLCRHAILEKGFFDCSLLIKERLKTVHCSTASSASKDGNGVRLPKLDVPTFSVDILNWQTFWEQFCVSVHDHSHLSNAEKLVYLRQAVKDGSARCTIEGLSRSGEHYEEDVECLAARYDRPRLIHQTHAKDHRDT